MTVTELPTVPSRSAAPNSFGTRFPPFLAALPLFRSELLGEFPSSLSLIPLAGVSGFAVTDLPVGFRSLVVTCVARNAIGTARQYRLRYGTASALSSTTADYSCLGATFVTATVNTLTVSSGIRLNFQTETQSVITASLHRIGTGNVYAFDAVNANSGRTNFVHGTLNVGGPVRQLALEDILTPGTPILNGFAEISWS